MRTNRGRVDSANPYPKFAERSAAKRAAAEKAKEAVEKLTAKLEAARKAQMDVEDTAAWMAEFDRLEAEVAAAEADTPMEGEETTQAEAMDEEAEATEAAEEAAEATVKRQKQDSEQPLDERPSTPAPFPPFSEPGSSTNPHPSEPGSSTASDSSAAPPVSKGRASKLPRVEGQNSWVSTASDDEPLAQASSRRNNIKKCINEIEEILKDSMVDIEKLKQWNDIVKTKYSEETVAQPWPEYLLNLIKHLYLLFLNYLHLTSDLFLNQLDNVKKLISLNFHKFFLPCLFVLDAPALLPF